MRKAFIFLFSLTVLSGSSVFGQLLTTSLTPAQYVQNVLLGAGVTASNISFTGNAQAISSFTFAPPGSLGFGSGLLMSTGKAVTGTNGPQGPNSSFSEITTPFSLPGDAALAAIAGEQPSDLYDAVVLEFDFIPQSDSVKFNYVFASEEYNNFVNTIYNDIFAFILSGVTTPLPATNIAIVPGTGTPGLPVAIENINNGNAAGISSGPCNNCAYFRDNYNGSINIAYDGLTTVLTAKHAVICGETYHIKLVIADVQDGTLDSGVFLEAGSFSSSAPFQISSSGTSMGPVGDATTIYEDCGFLALNFTRPTGTAGVADTLVLNISGNAIPGSDYTGLNDSILFPAGEDTVTMQIFAVPDGFGDAGDSIYVYYTYTNACNVITTVSITLKIQENSTPMSMVFPNDTTICQGNTVSFQPIVSGGAQPYLYAWQNSPSDTISTSNIFNATSVIQTYTYTVRDACLHYFLTDSVHVNVNPVLYITGTLDVLGSSNDTLMTEGCQNAVLTFVEHGLGAGMGNNNYNVTITGSVTNDGSDLGVTIPTTINFNGNDTVIFNLTAVNDLNNFEGNENITITISYNNNPCIPVTGQIVKKLTIKDPVPLAVELNEDTTICRGRSLPLTALVTGGSGNITYSWAHNVNLTTSSIVVIPSVTDTFYVTVQESCGAGATVKDSIIVTVLYNPPVVTSLSNDTICIGENYSFNTVVVPGTGSGNVTGNWLTGYTGDLQSNGTANSWIIYSVQESSTYIYSVKDECLKEDWDTLKLIAKDCELYVPNIVTSNGDNVNDVFYIKNIDENPGTSVSIMDRWGKKVYTSANYDNNWKPNDLNDGVYFYIVEPKEREKRTGYLHILNKK